MTPNQGEETGEGGNYPKVQVEEIYEPSKHLKAVLGNIKDVEQQ